VSTKELVDGEHCLAYDFAGFEGAVRFCSAFERERRADLDAEVAAVEVHRGLFEDRPLALSLLGPTQDRRGGHPGE
jgi:hypothetical protein